MNVLNSLQAERNKLAARLEALDKAIEALAGLGRGRKPGKVGGPAKKKRTMSASARKAIAAAQRARWAKWRKANAEK